MLALMKHGSRKEHLKKFESLFEAQEARLFRMAYLFLHDATTAEDAIQETFVQGLAAYPGFRGDSKPDVWLYSIALNQCRQHLRRSKVREGLADREKLDRGLAPGRVMRGPLTSLVRRETASCLAIALGHLTDLQRESFVLHYIEELPYETVAPMLGVSVVAARGLAHRARKILLAKLPPNLSHPFAP